MSKLNERLDELKKEIDNEIRTTEEQMEKLLADFTEKTGLSVKEISLASQTYLNKDREVDSLKYSVKFKLPPIVLEKGV